MVFNGLTKSDLIVYNALLDLDLPGPVRSSEIARITCYHQWTVKEALKRLDEYGVITRNRERPGQPYTIALESENHALLDT
jgi:predicted transcriptional regulator